MPALRLHAKFLVLVLGSLILFLGGLSYMIVYRQAKLLERKAEEEQHLLASAIYSDLKERMIEGTPRSTLNFMDNLRGTYGLVRLEVLRKNGSRAFGLQGAALNIGGVDKTFETGKEISFRENDRPPVQTILYPLKNDKECAVCHKNRQPILGVLLISLSLEDSLHEIGQSTRRLTSFLTALICVIGIVLYSLLRKVVLQPLAVLHKGAERIGRGELDHRISLSTNDELQDLAESFNVMAGRLKELHDGLEQKIEERTAEVEDKATRLYEYSRDMATISRLSTRVFNVEQSLDQMLDRFMHAVRRGLGYNRALLCLIDRKRAWLEVKRESGLAEILGIKDQPLSGNNPFAVLLRSGKELFVQDVSQDPLFGRTGADRASETLAVHVIPILTGTHDKSCWKEKNCLRVDCPAYNREDEKCWLLLNTLCGNSLIESYGDKLSYCMTCDVFPVLGILIVGVPAGAPYRKREVDVLRIVASEIGAALENHRLYEDNRRLVNELMELHSVTAGALATFSLDRALEVFTNSAVKFSGLDGCNFWLLSKDGRELIRKAGGCTRPAAEIDFCPKQLSADKGVLGRVIQENKIKIEYHAFNDPTPLGKAMEAHDLPSLLGIPLTAESRPVGVLSVHKKSTTPFLETEIAAFMLLANHAGMAINVCVLNEELKSQNRELAKSTSLMGGILSSMSNGVMLLDTEGTVQLINQAGARLLHSKDQEMINRKITDLFPDAEVFLKSSAGPYQEAEIKRQDGSSTPVGFSIAFYHGTSGQREGTIVVFRDLTQIKALEEAVLHKERFAAIGRVVAGVAHEIRNPLFGISSIGQIFERELKNPAHLELVRALLSETKRLNHLVEDLLIYGRPIKLSPAWCDLMTLWEEVIGMHREELAQKRIAVNGDLDLGHTLAFLDANQIRQVFLNLIRNAIDATPDGGEITIRLLLEDRHIIFKISDNGAGIPAENIDKVFDLFFTTKPKGSGMGLGICKKIVEDHGGSIQVESRQSGGRSDCRTGTTVTVKLPYRGAPQNIK